jgi:hypothetical protein
MLRALGTVAANQWDHRSARAFWHESLALELGLGDKKEIPWLLESLAGLAAAEGKPEHAVRLWGAAAALRAPGGGASPPPAAYERQMAAARASLGEEAFAAAWAEGRALSLEAAASYALEEGDPV